MAGQEAAKSRKESFSALLGLLYKRWTLDCIVSLAHAVSWDFSRRPELYQRVGKGTGETDLTALAAGRSTAADLTLLQSLYGFHPLFPDLDTRRALMLPVFGESDGGGSGNDGSAFQSARLPVLEAAAGFAVESKATGDPFHRERVRSAIIPLGAFLADLEGTSFRQTELRMRAVFDTAQAILKDPDVIVVFGINGAIDAGWPLASTDPQGAKLVERITSQLPDLPVGAISREAFVRMQRIAEKGSQSLGIILGDGLEDDDARIDLLIAQLFAWGSDLGLVGGARPQQAARLGTRGGAPGTPAA